MIENISCFSIDHMFVFHYNLYQSLKKLQSELLQKKKAMDNADLMPIVLLRRVEDLKKAGYKVSCESNKDGQFTLTIKKAENDEGSKHYIFYY